MRLDATTKGRSVLLAARLVLGLVVLASVPERGEAGPDPLRACEEKFAANPQGARTCACFYSLAVRENLQGEAIRRLTTHLSEDPDNPCLNYTLGRLRFLLGDPSTEGLFLRAAEGYASSGRVSDEVYVRHDLSLFYSTQEKLEAALEQVTTGLQLVGPGGDPILLATMELAQARVWLRLGEDLERIDRVLRAVETKVFPGGHAALQREALLELGNVLYLRGRFSEAESFFRRMVEVTQASGDTYGESTARLSLAMARMEQSPDIRARQETADFLRTAVATAQASQHLANEANARRMLGKLLGGREGRQELERSVRLARRLNDPSLLSQCLGSLAADQVEDRPAEARRRIDEALNLLRPSQPPGERVYGWFDRMQVDWATLPREEAIRNALGELNQIERLRALQRSDTGRAESFAFWTEVYYWLSGRLLESASGANRSDNLERAFSITESMRARVLWDALEASPIPSPNEDDPLWQQWNELQKRLVASNRRLLDLRLSPQERTATVQEQLRLEDQEGDLRDRILSRRVAGEDGTWPGIDLAEVSRPDFTTLEQIQDVLGENEALLSFQVALWENVYQDFEGGSWLLVTTRQSTSAYRLPDRVRLEPAIRAFRNLFPRRDGLEAVPAVTLFNDLLAEALPDLAPGIDRLVIVPDGHLHLLPFGALRAAESAPPLAARYKISIVPSATLWARFRQTGPAPVRPLALALADPMLARSQIEEAAPERGWSLAHGVTLDPLPHARREGRAVRRHLGRSSQLLVGREASEAALKTMDLRRFGILHFAAHALVDGEKPRRSAIVLAPGSVEDDGLLQPWEISRLDLKDTLVVLSTCKSATGQALSGEGPLSLARAFFQAGSRAVVASLWPLRDDEAAALFEAFYRHLSKGRKVAEALSAAQQERMEAGAPAAAWAGVTVLGDGALLPLPDGPPRGFPTGLSLALAGAMVVVLGFTVRAFRRRFAGSRVR